MRQSRGLVLLGAAALSFAVYLIPLLHIESGWHFIGALIAGPVDFSALTLAWLAVVLLLQFLAFLLFYWVLIRFRWVKVLAIAVLAPAAVIDRDAATAARRRFARARQRVDTGEDMSKPY